MKQFVFVVLLSILSTPTLAAQQTVTLSVPGMTCNTDFSGQEGHE